MNEIDILAIFAHPDDVELTVGGTLLKMKSLGYRTGAFSGNTFWFTREHGFGQGFLHFEDFFHTFEDMALRTAYGRFFIRNVRWELGYEALALTDNEPERRFLGDRLGEVRAAGQ